MSLLGVSRLIANSALSLGGSRIAWQRAELCPGVRRNGDPCYSEGSGSSDIDCTICGGYGVLYKKAHLFLGVYTDKSNQFEYDENGGLVAGKKTLSIPFNIPVTILKNRGTDLGDGFTSRRVARDRFTILSPDNQAVEVLYLKDEAVDPFINSGKIYRILEVENNY